MDPSRTNTNGFMPPGVGPFMMPGQYPQDYHGGRLNPQHSAFYHPASMPSSSPSSSNQSYPISSRPSPQLEFPPATPPHLTHSRRGSRESGETSSSNSTPHSGASAPRAGIITRLARSSGSDSSPLPQAAGRKRKVKRRGEPDDDEETFSDDGEADPVVAQKLRKEDAKKSRQDAEQKRRDQLKMSYDEMRKWVPGSTEKTSKVQLVGHATKHIIKLKAEKEDLLQRVHSLEARVQALQELNDKLGAKLMEAGVEVSLGDQAVSTQSQPPQHEARPPMQPPQSTVDRNMAHRGHSRHSSSTSQLGLQTSGLASSAPTAASSPFPPPGYPPTMSTPSSPMKMSGAAPPASMPPPHGGRSVPQLHLTHHNVSSAPSPLSSTSSNSMSRQSIYSPEVSSSSNRFYGDNSSSASSSRVSVNVGHLTLDEQQRSGQPSPAQATSNFNGAYPEANTASFSGHAKANAPINNHPYGMHHHPHMYASTPGLGLKMDQTDMETNNASDEGYHPSEGGMPQLSMDMDTGSQHQPFMPFAGGPAGFVFPSHPTEQPHPSAFNGVAFDFVRHQPQPGQLSFQQELAQEPTPPPSAHHLETNPYLASSHGPHGSSPHPLALQPPPNMGGMEPRPQLHHNHLSTYLSSPHVINTHSPSLSVHSIHSHTSTTPRNMTGAGQSVPSPRSPSGYEESGQLSASNGETTACISPSMLISDPGDSVTSTPGNELEAGGEAISVGGGSWYGS